MSYYLIQAAYTPASMAAIIQGPEDRRELVRGVINQLGGSLEGFWFSFGDHDVVAICQMPDEESMAAFSMAVAAGGGVKVIKTTPLLSWEEALHAMKRASESGYRPPGRAAEQG